MTDLSPEELQRKRKIAEAATPGPWRVDDLGFLYVVPGQDPAADTIAEPLRPEDAIHIAEFDPSTVLALLDEIERLRFEAGSLRAQINRFLPQDPPEEK